MRIFEETSPSTTAGQTLTGRRATKGMDIVQVAMLKSDFNEDYLTRSEAEEPLDIDWYRD